MPGIEVKLAYHKEMPMLNDKGIRTAINKGMIELYCEISDDQIQPGSLDIRIGRTHVFDLLSRRKYAEAMSKKSDVRTFDDIIKLEDILDNRKYCKNYPDKKDVSIIVPPFAVAEIYPHENISFNPNDFFLKYELRTSRARLGLKPWGKIMDADADGSYLSIINNNHLPIILYGQSKIASLFFNLNRPMRIGQGRHINSPRQIAKLLPEFSDGNSITPEGYVIFRVGKEAVTFKEFVEGGVIDTAKNIDDTFYEKHDLSKGYVLLKDTSAIVQLTPNVRLPPNIGIMLMHRPPYHMDMLQYGLMFADRNQVNAGWIDQGYNGGVNAHPFSYMENRLLKEGDILAYGVLYKYNSDSKRVYGDKTLNSHYQNSSGATTSKS
jgi:deoxycytidine triphosphate deaminase